MNFSKNRELGFTIYLHCTVRGFVDGKVEEAAHFESDDAGSGSCVQYEVHGAGEAGAGQDRTFCDVDSVNPYNTAWGYLCKAGLAVLVEGVSGSGYSS